MIPAFPTGGHMMDGMTLRDYFAAKALQGFCACERAVDWDSEDCAADAYSLADAMLAERNKP